MVAKKNLCVLILAAGKGTRMKSPLPKPLHAICGAPIISHILKAAQETEPAAIGVVVGHESELMVETIKKNLPEWGITTPIVFIPQTELSGSASAVKASLPLLTKFESVMILSGDTPMIESATLNKMADIFMEEKAGALVLGVTVPQPQGYGRIVRERDGSFSGIIEETEADAQTKKITEINAGMYMFNVKDLSQALAKIKPEGPKKEFYLPTALPLIKQTNKKVLVFNTDDYKQAMGINSKAQLAVLEAFMYERIAERLMDAGVRLIRPGAVCIEAGVKIGEDTVIFPGCHISGKTVIGKDCIIEGCTYISNSKIGDNVKLKMGSYLEDSEVAQECTVGPYAHLRPGTVLNKKVNVGNFCEIKKSVIGEGSKINHLSYIGDTEMGKNVNVGAGTITCNYDGVNKHKTIIGDNVFVGSNVNFVAPVVVESYSKIGAGSTITKEVPEGSLAIARARQVVLEKKGIKHD